MAWDVEFTDEFGAWWHSLEEATQDSMTAVIELLEDFGPHLRFPHSSGVNGSKHSHMRELRIQHAGDPYRIFYAFDPRRSAILLIGGNKRGDDRFYESLVPIADRLYDIHLKELGREGLI